MENEWTKRIKELEEENRYLRAGCQDDTHQCPIVGTNNTLIERIAELEAERDADRKREYGYSQQTVDALTAERDKLEAENKRLRELVDGATEVVEISNFTFPAQREWKAAWLKKAAKALKEASDESK